MCASSHSWRDSGNHGSRAETVQLEPVALGSMSDLRSEAEYGRDHRTVGPRLNVGKFGCSCAEFCTHGLLSATAKRKTGAQLEEVCRVAGAQVFGWAPVFAPLNNI